MSSRTHIYRAKRPRVTVTTRGRNYFDIPQKGDHILNPLYPLLKPIYGKITSRDIYGDFEVYWGEKGGTGIGHITDLTPHYSDTGTKIKGLWAVKEFPGKERKERQVLDDRQPVNSHDAYEWDAEGNHVSPLRQHHPGPR